MYQLIRVLLLNFQILVLLWNDFDNSSVDITLTY